MRAKTAKLVPTAGRVAVLAYDRLSMFEFSIACEVFGPSEAADLGVPWYDFVVCADRATVRFDNGLVLQVPRSLASLRRADTIVIPPCDDPSTVSEATITAIRQAHDRGARLISLCTGALVLARTGLLDGRRAVTHWAECEAFAAAYPSVTVDPKVLYVDEGDILTAAGSAASIDLCLYVVRLDHGAEVAGRLARKLVVQPHRDGGQAQYIDLPMPSPRDVEPFTDTLAWMSEHLHEPLSVADLAHRSAMSPRSFARHFAATTGSTPYRWLLRQRIQIAQRLLETSDLPIDLVAERTGLGNATNLRKHFHRQVGTSPFAYRKTFQPGAPAA
jgi:transcriptional regulator GlxA family with amidase domain